MKRILQLDSGGAKGIIQITALKYLEEQLGVPLYKVFDLIVGSSVGAVIGGVMSTGKVSMSELSDIMMDGIPKIFSTKLFRIPFFQPKHSRKAFDEIFDKCVGKDFLMKECIPKFMCTSVSKVDGRTHYFKGWEEKDGNLKLLDAISRSYAAPYYFGKIIDNETKQVWIDGAAGDATSTLIQAYVEILRQRWLLLEEHVHILSIGTGRIKIGEPFEKAKNKNGIDDILFYMNLGNGGLSRVQSVETRNELIKELDKYLGNLTFNRIDTIIPHEMNAMAKLEYLKDYQRIGKDLFKDIDLSYLQ